MPAAGGARQLSRCWYTIGRKMPSARPCRIGIYDISTNRGYVCVGDCFDTPRFAVDAIGDWWCDEGCRRYRQVHRL